MPQFKSAALIALVCFACLPAGDAGAQEPSLETDQDRTLYALGVALGNNVQQFNLTEAEIDLVVAGMTDAVLGSPYRVDMAAYGPRIQTLADERAAANAGAEKEASAAYADELAASPGAERFASGLVYIPITEGTGSSPSATDTVLVHYHGTLRDGTVFDSSVDRGEPISFPLNGVISCWTEGVQKMSVGGKSTLVCPSDIAYGDTGTRGIPGGAVLVFEVELLEIL